jgi:hypothetical protein
MMAGMQPLPGTFEAEALCRAEQSRDRRYFAQWESCQLSWELPGACPEASLPGHLYSTSRSQLLSLPSQSIPILLLYLHPQVLFMEQLYPFPLQWHLSYCTTAPHSWSFVPLDLRTGSEPCSQWDPELWLGAWNRHSPWLTQVFRFRVPWPWGVMIWAFSPKLVGCPFWELTHYIYQWIP